MSMDKSAIEQIQQAHAVDTASQSIAAALDQAGAGDVPFVALPENMRLHDLEKYLPQRVRYRGAMKTIVLADFARYVEDHRSEEGTVCFINPERMRATATFNLGTKDAPGHADYTASLTLQKTSEYEELLQVNGQPKEQKAMAEWFEDWKDFLQFFDAEGEPVEAKTAIAATRRMTIEAMRSEDHQADDFRTSRSAFQSVEAKSEHGMPHGFRFTCVPYTGLDEHSFEARIGMRTGGDTPAFRIQVKQLELEQQRISEHFMDLVEQRLSGARVPIYRGVFDA